MAVCVTVAKSGSSYVLALDGNLSNVPIQLPDAGAIPSGCPYALMTAAEWQAYKSLYNNVTAPFDYAQGAAIFGFFLTNTLLCWWVAKNAGLLMDLVRRAASTVRR